MAKGKGTASKVSPAMGVEDKRWQARMDADTLRAAGEIIGNRARISAAKAELNKGLTAISKLSKGK